MILYCDTSLKEACYVFEAEEPVVLPYEEPVTVNVGEYKAAITALTMAKSRKLRGLTLLTDSQLMTKQVEGSWKCHSRLRPYRDRVRLLLKEVNGEIHWIPRERNLAGIKLEEVKKNR